MISLSQFGVRDLLYRGVLICSDSVFMHEFWGCMCYDVLTRVLWRCGLRQQQGSQLWSEHATEMLRPACRERTGCKNVVCFAAR